MTSAPLAAMDLSKVRKTEDGKVSVVDVIVQLKKCTGNHAAQVYTRLLEEERVPECEARFLTSAKSGRQNRSEYQTAIATASEINEIIWQLPGTSEFRRNCAKVCVRYLGGDETLIEEIRMNRRLQEQLREETPNHPARLFGDAVEHECQQDSEVVKRKREELEIKKLDAEVSELAFSTKRRRVENYVECYSSLEAHGIRMDDRSRQANKYDVDTTLQPTQGHMLQDTPVKELCIRTFLLQHMRNPRVG